MNAVAIIIPTHKPQDYIYECLDSLVNQTCDLSVFQVFIILNGDRDPYFNDLENYLNKSGLNYKLLYTEVPGVSNARNIGLDYVNENNIKYVTFLDDDDLLSSNFIEESLIRAKPNTIVVCNTKTFSDNNLENLGEDYLTKSFNNNIGVEYNIIKYRPFLSTISSKLIPMSLIGSIRFNPNHTLGEDSLFGFEISNKIENMVLTNPDCIYYRRIRLNSASRSKYKKSILIKKKFELCKDYCKCYMSNIKNYNFILLSTRVLAQFQHIFQILKK